MRYNNPRAILQNKDAHRLMRVALGHQPAQTAIVNARVVNVYTAEVLSGQTILIDGAWIAYVGEDRDFDFSHANQVIDAAGRVIIPGLIDGHTHLAWFFSVPEFLNAVIPGGTTTIITETMESYPVAGYEGVCDFLASLADQPIKIFATAPAGASTSQQTLGIRPEDLKRFLQRDDILGLGESYWQTVLQQPQRLLPALTETLIAGKRLEGHSAGARGRKLAAYAATGIASCHEPITAEEVLARLRLGICVMAREGSIRRDLESIAPIKDQAVDLRHLVLVTDGIQPGELLENGYMEYVLQRALEYGFAPVTAIQAVTLNVAEHFRIDHLVGAVAPGRLADLLLLPDLTTIEPDLVISNGKVVAEKGQLMVAPRPHRYASASYETIRLPRKLNADDFALQLPKGHSRITVRIIDMVTDLVTREIQEQYPVTTLERLPDPTCDLLKVAAVDRTHQPGRLFTGLIRGFGLKSGAMACSAAWDTSTIIVVGASAADMATAVNRIATLQGGAVVAQDGAILAELPLPVFGLISEWPLDRLALAVNQINQGAANLGVPFPDPLLSLVTLTGAAIPHLRICEEGLVNLRTGQALNLWVPES
ncbi:MAG: adenine deaminase C-terminal domain-containing protein [Desulfobacteraceae bacterium]|jgi:adenine deaminase